MGRRGKGKGGKGMEGRGKEGKGREGKEHSPQTPRPNSAHGYRGSEGAVSCSGVRGKATAGQSFGGILLLRKHVSYGVLPKPTPRPIFSVTSEGGRPQPVGVNPPPRASPVNRMVSI